MEVRDEGVHDAFVPGTSRSPVSQEPLREGEDGGRKGGAAGRLWSFILLRAMGSFFLGLF